MLASCHETRKTPLFLLVISSSYTCSVQLFCLLFVKCTSLSFSSSIFTDNLTMSAEVENILKSFWEWRLKESPEFATQIGVHTYDKILDDHSLDAYAKRQVQ